MFHILKIRHRWLVNKSLPPLYTKYYHRPIIKYREVKVHVANSASFIRERTHRENEVICQSKRSASTHTSVKEEDSSVFGKKYAEVTGLLNNHSLRQRYMHIISTSRNLSDHDAKVLYENFLKIIDLVSFRGRSSSINLIVETWKAIFSRQDSEPNTFFLHRKFLEKKDVIIHLLINNRMYSTYTELIKPLYGRFGTDYVAPSWADTLMSTFCFETNPDGLGAYDITSIILFLKKPAIAVEKKRELLTIFARKGILYAKHNKERSLITKDFLRCLKYLGDDHLLFLDETYNVYAKAVQLISTPSTDESPHEHLYKIREIMSKLDLHPQAYLNFLTTSMKIMLLFSPELVIEYWKAKRECLSGENNTLGNKIRSEDLKFCMLAFSSMNMYQVAIDLYKENEELQSEDQIEVLLKISEGSKDFRLMQKQFEDMYGKGNLPYVVHYSIVMNCLAKIGASKEVHMLYTQLSKRRLEPNSAIYAALINGEIYYNNLSGAIHWLNEYFKRLEYHGLDSYASAYLYSLLFKQFFKASDIDGAMTLLDKALVEESKIGISLINAKTLSLLVTFAASVFDYGAIQRCRLLADRKNLHSELLCASFIKAYTKLDEFAIAEELAYNVHAESSVPFKSSQIWKVQLRNYRLWYLQDTSFITRRYIDNRVSSILDFIEKDNISVKIDPGLYCELIQLHLARNDQQGAELVFNKGKKRGFLNESFYIPFLKKYDSENTFAGYSKVLDLYKEMVSEGLQIRANTYLYLTSALLYLDKLNRNGYCNSFKLLQSLLELSGLTTDSSKPSNEITDIAFSEEVSDICKTIVRYIMATSDHNNMNLLITFLNQVRDKLGTNLSYEFKHNVYSGMCELYLKLGNVSLANNLAESGLYEVKRIILRYLQGHPKSRTSQDEDISVPLGLQKNHNKLIDLKIKCMEAGLVRQEVVEDILKHAENLHLVLSGKHYNFLLGNFEIISEERLKLVLRICEEHLVSGNWTEVKLMRKLQYLYKLAILCLSRTMEKKLIEDSYYILNDYYGVKDVAQLGGEFATLKDPMAYFQTELRAFVHQYRKFYPKSYSSPKYVLANIPQFFLPEFSIVPHNKISFHVSNKLWDSINIICAGEKTRIFELMQEYPETLEYTLYNIPFKGRLLHFRRQVNAIQRPLHGRSENIRLRQQRTIEALNRVRMKNSLY